MIYQGLLWNIQSNNNANTGSYFFGEIINNWQ